MSADLLNPGPICEDCNREMIRVTENLAGESVFPFWTCESCGHTLDDEKHDRDSDNDL